MDDIAHDQAICRQLFAGHVVLGQWKEEKFATNDNDIWWFLYPFEYPGFQSLFLSRELYQTVSTICFTRLFRKRTSGARVPFEGGSIQFVRVNTSQVWA